MMCHVRLRNPPVPSPYTVKETLRFLYGQGNTSFHKSQQKKNEVFPWPYTATEPVGSLDVHDTSYQRLCNETF